MTRVWRDEVKLDLDRPCCAVRSRVHVHETLNEAELTSQLAQEYPRDPARSFSTPSPSAHRMKAAAAAHELRCRYKGKRCEHPRSTKSNGKLHLLCQKHRERANENQKRIDERKRSMKHAENDDGNDEKQEETGLQAHEDSDEYTERTTRIPGESIDDKDDESIEFRDSVLDLDDMEIEELQALVVAGELQEAEHEPIRRIDP